MQMLVMRSRQHRAPALWAWSRDYPVSSIHIPDLFLFYFILPAQSLLPYLDYYPVNPISRNKKNWALPFLNPCGLTKGIVECCQVTAKVMWPDWASKQSGRRPGESKASSLCGMEAKGTAQHLPALIVSGGKKKEVVVVGHHLVWSLRHKSPFSRSRSLMLWLRDTPPIQCYLVEKGLG